MESSNSICEHLYVKANLIAIAKEWDLMSIENLSQSETSLVSNKAHKKLILTGILCLFILHYIIGFIQTPVDVIEFGRKQGFSDIYVKVGYAFGIFCIYALPIPLGISLLSLLLKSKRKSASFTKILFWCLVITLALNILMGFVFAPRAVSNVNFNTI